MFRDFLVALLVNAVLTVIADMTAQLCEVRTGKLSHLGPQRAIKLGAISLLLSFPLTTWYWYLDWVFRAVPDPNSFQTQLVKVVLDQGLVSPPYFWIQMNMKVLAFNDPHWTKMKDWLDVLCFSYLYWPPSMLFVFHYVPVAWQIVVSKLLGFPWSFFFSIIVMSKNKKGIANEKEESMHMRLEVITKT